MAIYVEREKRAGGQTCPVASTSNGRPRVSDVRIERICASTKLFFFMPGGAPALKLAYACALVGTAAYAIGYLASWWLPEPKSEQLPG